VVDPEAIEAAGNTDSEAVIGDVQQDYELRLALQTLKAPKDADTLGAIRQSRAP
jgi:hypothetical protein